jgi:twitching motility two-component system response regulator PilG
VPNFTVDSSDPAFRRCRIAASIYLQRADAIYVSAATCFARSMRSRCGVAICGGLVPFGSLAKLRIRTMAHADYQTALKNGIDAARSGSRMMARLHLLKAADLAPDDVAAHLWLAWVAETPADALSHFDEALARQPKHALTRLGRIWTQVMAEFDSAKDYAAYDFSAVGGAPAVSPRDSHVAEDMSKTQRLGGLTLVEKLRKSSPPETHSSPQAEATKTHAPAAQQANDQLDIRQTVRMDLIRRQRPDEDQEPSPALTCLIPTKSIRESAAETNAPSNVVGVNDELPKSGTVRVDPNAVRRALAESVIAEMTEPDRGTHTAGGSQDAVPVVEAADAAANVLASSGGWAVNEADAPPEVARGSRIDEYTEPPVAAISPDMVDHNTERHNVHVQTLTGPRVLVVDDSPTVRKLVAATLEAQGYRVACVSSGYEAVEVLAHTTPDALVIEVDLPRLDGLHLCKLLRSQEATKHMPVIFLTRRSGTMDRMRGKMVGATGYLTKPFRSIALIDEMASCCPAHRD